MTDWVQCAAVFGYFAAGAFFGGFFHRMLDFDCDSPAGFFFGLFWPLTIVLGLALFVFAGTALGAVLAGNWCGDRIRRLFA